MIVCFDSRLEEIYVQGAAIDSSSGFYKKLNTCYQSQYQYGSPTKKTGYTSSGALELSFFDTASICTARILGTARKLKSSATELPSKQSSPPPVQAAELSPHSTRSSFRTETGPFVQFLPSFLAGSFVCHYQTVQLQGRRLPARRRAGLFVFGMRRTRILGIGPNSQADGTAG